MAQRILELATKVKSERNRGAYRPITVVEIQMELSRASDTYEIVRCPFFEQAHIKDVPRIRIITIRGTTFLETRPEALSESRRTNRHRGVG